MKILTAVALLVMMSTQAFSRDIFVVTKNISAKNILHYDVKVENCAMPSRGLTAFWIMGETNGQVLKMSREEAARFSPNIIRESAQSVEFTLPVFNEINNPIANSPVQVKLVNCKPKAYIKIEGQNIELVEVHANISLLKMGLKYLLIKGKRANGSDFTHKING